MSQSLADDFPIDPTTTSGDELADILNRFNAAVTSSNSGGTAPPATYPGMMWLDTSVTPNVMRIRNADNTGWDTIPTSAYTGPVLFSDGTQAAPGIAYKSEPTLGWYRSAAGTINTTAASAVFNGIAKLSNGTAAAPSLAFNSEPTLGWYRSAAGTLNTSAASAVFDGVAKISNGTVGAPSLAFNSEPGLGLYRSAAGVLNVASGGVQALQVGSTGTVAPAFVVNGTTGWFGLFLSGGNNLLRFGSGYQFVFTPSGDLFYQRANGKSTIFSTVGDFYAGGSSVYCDDGSTIALIATPNFPKVRFTSSNWRWELTESTGSLAWHRGGDNQVLFQFTIEGNANKFGAGTAWGNLSDARFKNVTGDYEAGLAEVLQIQVRRFVYKDMPDVPCVGPIADEIMEVLPETVTILPSQRGELSFEDGKMFDASNVTWALVNAVKELNTRLVALEH